MSDLAVPNIICIQTQKQLATLNNFWVLLKSVLIDLGAHNFVHMKTSLHACCMHTCHRAHNLLSPEIVCILFYLLQNECSEYHQQTSCKYLKNSYLDPAQFYGHHYVDKLSKSHLHIEISHSLQPVLYHLYIYKRNSKGPKIDPCGNPHSILAVLEY